jgi:hypothetical protein
MGAITTSELTNIRVKDVELGACKIFIERSCPSTFILTCYATRC